ncbi:NPCBM/NEW2 domain-containing protein [Streptosporangium saharense]|uniref:NPCBM/NEW2 domain-containing protein n=1 Tax=Streptosporangium saharense TaxID=1706840 RepID=UPI003690960A
MEKKRFFRDLGHSSWQGISGIIGVLALVLGIVTYFFPSEDKQSSSPSASPTATLSAPADRKQEASPPPTENSTAPTPNTSPTDPVPSAEPVTSEPVTPEPVYLDDLEQVEGYLVTASHTIDGHEYSRSVSQEIGSSYMCGDIDPAVAGFNLGRKYKKLHVVAGLSDDTTSNVRGRFKVLGDGKLLKSATALLGEPKQMTVDVSGVLRLKLVASTQVCQYGDWGSVVWGDPVLTAE